MTETPTDSRRVPQSLAVVATFLVIGLVLYGLPWLRSQGAELVGLVALVLLTLVVVVSLVEDIVAFRRGE